MACLYFAVISTTGSDLGSGTPVLDANSGVVAVTRETAPVDSAEATVFRVEFEQPVGDGSLYVHRESLSQEGDAGRFDGDDVLVNAAGGGRLHVLVFRN